MANFAYAPLRNLKVREKNPETLRGFVCGELQRAAPLRDADNNFERQACK